MSAIESVLVENRVFPPSEATVRAARISGMGAYEALCAEANTDFEGFWSRLARGNVVWSKPFTRTLDESNAPFYKWFDDGELNASANCLDKHMGTPVENKTAVIFESDDGQVTRTTYRELLTKVSQFANALKADGIRKGDRVLIYMPMTLEGVVAMQACARIGATHSVVFGGFSAKALQERIIDAGAVAVITANFQMRGGRELPLKAIVDEGLSMGGCDSIKTVFVYQRTTTACNMVAWSRQDFLGSSGRPEHRVCPAGRGCRAPAVHPVHIRFHGQTQGRAALYRGLPLVGQAHHGLDLRFAAQ
jgi:acetyl-CoA synthetase